MFHFAEPDEAGSGVTILTPGLIRSSHPLMCSGLPLRTVMTTTESDTRPLVEPLFQLGSTRVGTSFVRSGVTENAT